MKKALHKLKWKILNKMKNSKGLFFHLTGIICLIWFLARVIPKPDRIRYPCQQTSLCIATGYVAFWIVLWGSLFFGLGLWVKRMKYKTAAYTPVFIVILILIFSVTSNVYAVNYVKEKDNIEIWEPISNEAMGVPTGLNPGRVVWVWNKDATEKDLVGYWWEQQNNNQDVIDQMTAEGIKNYAGVDTEKEAWDLLFEYFNQEQGKGKISYQPGERIAIKVNLNNCWQPGSYLKEDNERDASPYVVKALLRQLVNVVGVNQEDITIFDASRPMPDWFYYRVLYKNYPGTNLEKEFQNINYKDQKGLMLGRQKVQASDERVYFAEGTCEYRTMPECVIEADYLIDMPIMKRHPIQNGVTLSAKNYFGTFVEDVVDIHPYHESGLIMDNAAPQVDLLAYEHLGGKTLLYFADGLYATKIDHATIDKFSMEPFNNDWTNSLFFSQDPVAIDSVMYDFLHTEGTNPIEGSQNYMHQAAVPAENKYDPENDGIYLGESLGVHEHWDKSVDIFSSDRYDKIDFVSVITEDTRSVKITSPIQGYLYLKNNPLFRLRNTIVIGNISVELDIDKDNYELERVEIHLNDELMKNIYDEPYEWNWDKPTNSWFNLKTTVYFHDGESFTTEMDLLKLV